MMRSIDSSTSDADRLELVEELELNQSVAIDQVRLRSCQQINAEVTIRPANASDRGESCVVARTVEVGQHQIQVICSRPLAVGDVYLVSFDTAKLSIPNSYMICSSCSIQGEDRFTAELGFFVPVELSIP